MTDNGRSYILERLKSKRTTIEEFNFDKLIAPPLGMFFTPYDIARLYEIATSVSLSSKPKEKYKLIDDIMRYRGMRRCGSGTNRLVYYNPEFNNIVFKVAYDYVAMTDNKAEFQNQFILKPFVTKIFEVDPTGVIAVVERVKPIINREEFLSIADDIFELINTWIIGKYIMADIGEKFFMNYGVRENMGVVLCDYPYLYELDGDKLFCAAPNPLSPSGKCDGVIDYDDGFNFLVCKKCGCKYKANELAKHLETKQIIQRNEGGTKMVIRTKGGSAPAKVITINDDSLVETSNIDAVSVAKIPSSKSSNVKTVNGANISSKDEKKKMEEIHKKHSDNAMVREAYEITKEKEEVVEAVVEEVKKPEEVKNAISFDSNAKVEIKEEDMNASPVADIESEIGKIIKNLKKINIDEVRDKILKDIIFALYDNDPAQALKVFSSITNQIIDDFEDEESYKKALADAEVFENTYASNYDIMVSINRVYTRDDENYAEVSVKYYYDIDVSMNKTDKVEPLHEDRIECKLGDLINMTNKKSKDMVFGGISLYQGKIINTKDVIPASKPSKILVAIDGDSNFLTDDENNIIAIETVDNIEINKSELVSSTWLQNALGELEYLNMHGNAEEASDEEDTEIDVSTDDSANNEVYEQMAEFIKNNP